MKTVEEIYTKKELHQHILDRPDSYIGSTKETVEERFVYDEKSKKVLAPSGTRCKSESSFAPPMQTPVDLLRTLALFTTLAAEAQAEIKDGKWQDLPDESTATSLRRISLGDLTLSMASDSSLSAREAALYNQIIIRTRESGRPWRPVRYRLGAPLRRRQGCGRN